MRIGIVTQPLHSNYGGLLQNYALQQVLKRFGNEVVTLDQTHSMPKRWRIYAACFKTFLLRLMGKRKNCVYPFYITESIRTQICKYTDDFIYKYISRSPILNGKESFRNYTKKVQLDALIVGSDQVWRPRYNQDVLRSFLDFSEGLKMKRIAYAASFGVDLWELTQKQTLEAKKLIKQFDAVSVREDSGVDLCRKHLECSALHVLDPTMLLDKEDYISLVDKEKEPLSEGDLFTYILDDSVEKQKIIQNVALALSLTPFTCMPQKKVDRESIKNIDMCVFPPVTRWLRSFVDAKFVVCDSFHGAVFSIIFNKPFLIIGNKERGMSRFDSLLDTFELHNRMVDNISNIPLVIKTPIDWNRVNKVRSRLKIFSMNFLKSSF